MNNSNLIAPHAKIEYDNVTRDTWYHVLLHFGFTEKELTSKREVPCPTCGGHSRFVWLKEFPYALQCRHQCVGHVPALTPAKALEHHKNISFSDINDKIREVQGNSYIPVRHDIKKDYEPIRNVIEDNFTRVKKIGESAGRKYLLGRGISQKTIDEARLGFSDKWFSNILRENGQCIVQRLVLSAEVTGNKAIYAHLTFVDDNGKKLAKEWTKKMRSCDVGVVGKTFDIGDSELLGVAEGLEKTLKIRQLTNYSYPIWNVDATDNMEKFIPPKQIKELIIFADNDASYAGQKSAYTLAKKLCDRKRDLDVVVMVAPKVGVDWDEMDRF